MSICIEKLDFSYGSHRVLKDISVDVADGTLVNVLGPNGTGKSTLFRCILGLNKNYQGTIIVNGKDIRKLSIRERAKEMAYIPQSHKPVYDYAVLDVVLMSAGASSGMLFTHAEKMGEAFQFFGFSGKPAGYMIIFCICAVAYLIGWSVMKTLVPKYEPVVVK